MIRSVVYNKNKVTKFNGGEKAEQEKKLMIKRNYNKQIKQAKVITNIAKGIVFKMFLEDQNICSDSTKAETEENANVDYNSSIQDVVALNNNNNINNFNQV
jgi:hypothetical protein